MMRRNLLVASAILGTAVMTACDGQNSSVPTAPPSVSASRSSVSAARQGALYVTKNCGSYTGHAGDFCTITTSTLDALDGSIVVYAEGAVGTSVDTDVTLYAPQPGNTAFGHCTLSLATGIGQCRFSGGTGSLAGFKAKVAVSPLGGLDFAWDGKYHFSGDGARSDED